MPRAEGARPQGEPMPETMAEQAMTTPGGERSDEGRRGRRRRRGRRGGTGRGHGAGEGGLLTMPPADEGEVEGFESEPTGEPAAMAPMAGEGEGSFGGPREPRERSERRDLRDSREPREPRERDERGERREASSSTPMLTGDALAAEGKRWTEQLLSAMGFESTVRATADGDRVNVTATVESDEQLLGGERGEVREAMQQILNRMINRGEGSRYYLRLEINDFWEKREADLKSLALRLAEEALEKNAEVATDYLNAQERRIIHVTLREDSRVKTYSLGIGHIKRLAVAPADHPGGAVSES